MLSTRSVGAMSETDLGQWFSDPARGEGGAGRIGAASSMDATSWMGPSRSEEEPVDKGARSAHSSNRAKHQLLMQLSSATIDRAPS